MAQWIKTLTAVARVTVEVKVQSWPEHWVKGSTVAVAGVGHR